MLFCIPVMKATPDLVHYNWEVSVHEMDVDAKLLEFF